MKIVYAVVFVIAFLATTILLAEETLQPGPAVLVTPPVVTSYERIKVFDPLPDYVYGMTKKEYIKWVKAQNKSARNVAVFNAYKFNRRNPPFKFNVMNFSASSITDYTVRHLGWGGGPVIVINPYAKRPSKMIDGVLMNPDGVK